MAKRNTNPKPYQVFVSHATTDKWLATTLCEKIEAAGAATFRDDRDIDGGDDIPERIRSEIKRSRELVVLLTMKKHRPAYDVFLTHRRQDAELAADIARILRSYDLAVFTDADMPAGEPHEDTLWDAMAESQALVTVIPDGEASPRMLVELGAAQAWNKPTYGIVIDPSSTRLPPALRGLAVYPRSRMDEIAQEIKRSSPLLSDAETAVLIDEYLRISVPVDQLVLQPALLSQLTKQFKARTKRQFPAEQLVRMLLRLRRSGKLLAASKKRHPKAS